MSRRSARYLLLLCTLAFAAAMWGSVDCGTRLADPDLPVQDATRLRRLIYFHFALSQLAVLGAVLVFYARHARWKRYYLLVSYNEQGMPLDPPGIRMPSERVYRCNLHALGAAELPPDDAPVLVYPMMMLSGKSSGERLEAALAGAFRRIGRRPELYYQPVLGASPWLARAAAERLKPLLAAADGSSTGILVVAHDTTLPEQPPEPALFCRRLRRLLPGVEIELGYMRQAPLGGDVLARMNSPHILLLPFLLTEGYHATRDLPTAAQAAACGKTLRRLPVVAALLSGENGESRESDAAQPTSPAPAA